MDESPEEFRYVHPSGNRSDPFLAVSPDDAVAFVRLEFCPHVAERTARSRVECRFAGRWVRLSAYDRFLRDS